jgi:trehalose-6-phosphatase
MTYLFSRNNAHLLPSLAASNVLLGFDYDGTLAPRAPAPDRAKLRTSTRRLLRRLSQLYPCVVISERSHSDLARRVGSINVMHLLSAAPRKGPAIDRRREDFSCDTLLYVGDDATDEEVFRLQPRGRLLSIRVGRARTSAATCYIRSQAEIDRVLQTLIGLRDV